VESRPLPSGLQDGDNNNVNNVSNVNTKRWRDYSSTVALLTGTSSYCVLKCFSRAISMDGGTTIQYSGSRSVLCVTQIAVKLYIK